MTTTRRHACSRGFTLIELMVTVAIAAILMAIAAPSFTEFRRNSELTSAANTLLASINAARTEAMKRNMAAFVVPTDGSAWTNGWIVFVDTDNSQTYGATNDLLVSAQAAQPSYMTVSGNGTAGETPPYIMFNASGYPAKKTGAFGALTLSLQRTDVATARKDEQTRRIVISSAGRVRVCKPATDTSCTNAANE
jgi:type IV fimbrial biogenesis protein FimT